MNSFEKPPVENETDLTPLEQIVKMQQAMKDNAGLAELGKAAGAAGRFDMVMEKVKAEMLKDSTDKSAVNNALAEVNEAMAKYTESAEAIRQSTNNTTNAEANLEKLGQSYEGKLSALYELVM